MYSDVLFFIAGWGGDRNDVGSQILCRSPHMDDETYNMLVEKAKGEGYDVSKLHKTPQPEPPPEDAPKDTKGAWWIKSLLGK